MPSPAIYTRGIEQAFSDRLPPELKSSNMPILYATDRTPEGSNNGVTTYGIGRERSLAFGEAMIELGAGKTWQELVEDANSDSRRRPLKMQVRSVTERTRTPDYPLQYSRRHGQSGADPNALRIEAEAKAATKRLLKQRLSAAPKKEILICVHGFATTFEEALYATAAFWHYTGREFVPLTYSWPAGRGNFLRGYAYDRESGEHTMFHLKRLLQWLSSMPEVEGIHLISHSRGTDVTVTALRELAIESREKGASLQRRYKIRNVVLAAPDLSGEIALQRLTDGGANSISERWLTYTSNRDKAIGVAEYLFGEGRMGRIGWDRLEQEDIDALEWYSGFFGKNDATVEYQGSTGGNFGHEFHMADPVVSSDLILALRFGRKPGPQNGRPLQRRGSILWAIDEDYFDTSQD